MTSTSSARRGRGRRRPDAPLRALLVALVVGHALATEARTEAAPPPPKPVWPRAFRVAFNETTGLPIIGGSTSGVMYYDADQGSERIDRANGHVDRYCGSVHPFKLDTPCTHVATAGRRFLLFPALHGADACCSCCTFADGCGPVRADWLRNATYVPPRARRGAGEACWKVEGLQDNFFCQAAGSRAPLRIVQGGGSTLDDQEFDAASFVEGGVDPAAFAVPDGCAERKCGGVCRFI